MGSYVTDVKQHIKETPSACERTETVIQHKPSFIEKVKEKESILVLFNATQ